MNSASVLTVFSQLLAQSPLLLCYVLGIILALLRWGRQPKAAMLAFIGCLVLLLVSIGQAVAQYVIVMGIAQGTQTAGQISQTLAVVSLAGNLLRAGGFAAVLAAVFVGRPAPVLQGFPVGRV